jgi:hypothetical protein
MRTIGLGPFGGLYCLNRHETQRISMVHWYGIDILLQLTEHRCYAALDNNRYNISNQLASMVYWFSSGHQKTCVVLSLVLAC